MFIPSVAYNTFITQTKPDIEIIELIKLIYNYIERAESINNFDVVRERVTSLRMRDELFLLNSDDHNLPSYSLRMIYFNEVGGL